MKVKKKKKGLIFSRKARRTVVKPYSPPVIHPPAEVIGTIQGRIPMSKEEWWCAQYLEAHHIPYQYQYPVFGDAVKGSYNIDFMILSKPLMQAVELYGAHWHTGTLGQDDLKREIEIEDQLRDEIKIPLTRMFADDMLSHENLDAALERKIRNA